MNADATVNVVVFEVEIGGRLEKRLGEGPTRADDCVRQVWGQLSADGALRPEGVRRVFSEWEPSAGDRAFMESTFPKGCEVLFSYRRPVTEAGWDEALRQAEEQIRQATAKKAADEGLATTKNRLDDLLPVLRTLEPGDVFSPRAVGLTIGPGLGLFLGHVNWKPRQTIGTRYVMKQDVAALGRPAEELMAVACRNLACGLRVDAVQIEGERAFVVKHPMGLAASAIGLPDLYANASQWTRAEELFVGFPDPSLLLVTRLEHAKAVAAVRQAIVTSDYWGAVALTPACYRLDAAGLELIAARPKAGAGGSG